MQRFQWVISDGNGELRSGSSDAESAKEIRQRMESNGFVVHDVQPVEPRDYKKYGKRIDLGQGYYYYASSESSGPGDSSGEKED